MNPLSRDFRKPDSCGCRETARPRVLAERPGQSRPFQPGVLAERRSYHKDGDFEHVSFTTIKGVPCRPFFHVERDPEAFAACNAFADEIGPLNEPKKAFRLLEEAIGDEPYEVFGFVTLDLHNRFKDMGLTGRGEAAAVMAPMVPTMQAIMKSGPYSALIVHCHPSGIKAKPSQADKDTTKAFEKAFEVCGVVFIDHLIVAGDAERRSYFSFLEAGLLKS